MKQFIAIFALLPALAVAGSATVSWSLPTLNDDGSTIAATGTTSLASTRVEYFQCASAASTWPASPAQVTVAVPGTSATIPALTEGLLYCFRARVATVGGVFSLYSNVATKLIPVPTPNPPTNLTVAVILGSLQSPVYGVLADNSRSSVVYGLIDAGKPCGATALFTYRSRTWREVAKGDVLKWSGVTLPSRVAAPCG